MRTIGGCTIRVEAVGLAMTGSIRMTTGVAIHFHVAVHVDGTDSIHGSVRARRVAVDSHGGLILRQEVDERSKVIVIRYSDGHKSV